MAGLSEFHVSAGWSICDRWAKCGGRCVTANCCKVTRYTMAFRLARPPRSAAKPLAA